MTTLISVDEELLAKAQEYTDLTDKSALMGEALTAFIQREAARRLARMGGTQPDLEDIPRRRPEF
jgi:Arc/MetJ family transcription regulator